MSKNYELLSQLGGPLTMIQPRPAVATPGILKVPPTKTLKVTASEEENTLVQRVFLLPGQGAPRSVVLCGVDQRDGSSLACARVGAILAARTPGRLCLVDADLRSPSLHACYGIENESAGNGEVLEPGAARNFARQIAGSNLWLLSAGSRNAEGEGIVSPDRLRDRFLEVREQFDYVLISAPPVNLSADAIMFGQLADGVILVIKASSTRRAAAMKAKESLEAANVKLLGAILSERTFPIPEALYRML